MPRFFFLLCIISLSIGCVNTRRASQDVFLSLYHGKSFVAWNEDTVNSYQVLIKEGKQFSYSIIRTEGSKKNEEFYKGTFEFLNDTLFLTFAEDLKPKELASYLIVEASDQYLIQPFQNKPGRIFLRIQRFSKVI